MKLTEYAWMLEDAARIGAFRRAIAQRVKPGDVVVEVGAGLGTYSFFACQAGAARVYAIEDSVADALEELARRQGFGDRLKVLRENSLDAVLPERADWIIFEDFNSAFLGGGLAPVVRDAAARFLAPGGGWIPSVAEVWAALAEVPESWGNIARWRREADHLKGLDYWPLSAWILNSGHKGRCVPGALITSPRLLRRYRLGDPEEKYDLGGTWEDSARRTGSVHAVCAWFRLELAEGVWLDNGPGADETVYEQEIFTLPEALPVEAGGAVRWSLQGIPEREGDHVWWKWGAEAGGRAYEGNTFAGAPLRLESLADRSAEKIPRPGRRQEIMRFVLDCADGRLTQGEIAAKVRATFPEDFPEERHALRYVARIFRG